MQELSKEEKEIVKAVKENGFDHCLMIVVKHKGGDEIEAVSLSHGDMDIVYSGVYAVLQNNQNAFNFFSTVLENLRQERIKSNPNIN